MKGWIIVVALVLTILTMICVGMYVSVNRCVSFFNHESYTMTGSDEEITEQVYPLNSTGSVSINAINGSITVTSHEKAEVLVKIIKEGKKNDFAFVVPSVSAKSDALSLSTTYKKSRCRASLSFELVIPKTASVKAQSTNGTISVTDVAGTVTAESTNGSLTLEQTPRLVSAETTNGRISVQADTIISQNKAIVIESTNGSINLTVATLEKNKFSVETTNGSITLNLPGDLSNYQARKHSASFTAGQASFEVETTNGSISINKI